MDAVIVEHNQRGNGGAVFIGIVIMLLLLGIFFFIFIRSNNQDLGLNLFDRKDNYKSMDLFNKTNLMYTVVLPDGQNMNVEPGQKISFAINLNDSISASSYNYDGTISKFHYKITHPDEKNLFIGNSGIFSNLSSTNNVTFVNEAPYPVMFIEKSSQGGKRWASDIILPQNETQDHFVSKRSIWQVCHPTDETVPISTLTVGGLPKKLVFNGKILKAF